MVAMVLVKTGNMQSKIVLHIPWSSWKIDWSEYVFMNWLILLAKSLTYNNVKE